MKNIILNIRVSESTKDDLDLLSCTLDKSISSLIRNAINDFIDKTIEQYSNKESICTIKDYELLQSLGFTEFIFWLYEKRRTPYFYEINELYSQFIELINNLETHPLFTSEIMDEFKKVKLELEAYLNTDKYITDLQFPLDNENCFNYDKLAYFMYSIRYTEENKKIIHIK
ncbi:ribbon-helix-helix protein, CopG family [Winogradskyella sp. PC D3.3]